jgi:hypothetical protein
MPGQLVGNSGQFGCRPWSVSLTNLVNCCGEGGQVTGVLQLLVASPALSHLSARQMVALYARRMQIELSFRDLKSHRYGHAFEDSLTRKGKRIEVLLLLHTMAAFASWLVGMACETAGIDQWLTPFRSKRRLYSIMRLGREALVRRWSNARLDELMEQIRKPCPALLDQMAVAA